MCNSLNPNKCLDGTHFEYYLLSTFGYNSALTRYPGQAKVHYCCPNCEGCESPELWRWRTVYDSETLESDGACPRCLQSLLDTAERYHIPVAQAKAWKS